MSIAVHATPVLLPTRHKKTVEIEYPTSDGKPMAETEVHRDLMIDHISMLQGHYEHNPDKYVSGNNFIYYMEGHLDKCLSPDLYIVEGVHKHQRDTYKVWEEGGITPSFALEFTSKKTRNEDQKKKFKIYEQELKTKELVFFDPTGDYLEPPLQGNRLENGRYVRMELKNGRLYSEVLGLEIVADGKNLRLYDPVTEEWLLTPLEQRLRADREARRAEQEARRAEQEARRAEQEAQRADDEAQRANTEAAARKAAEAKAETLTRRTEEQTEARKAADAEIERLRKELEAYRQRGH